jgi:hypothetical protein
MDVILKYTWNFLEYCVKNYVKFQNFLPLFRWIKVPEKIFGNEILISDCPLRQHCPLCPTLAPASLINPVFILVRNCIIFIWWIIDVCLLSPSRSRPTYLRSLLANLQVGIFHPRAWRHQWQYLLGNSCQQLLQIRLDNHTLTTTPTHDQYARYYFCLHCATRYGCCTMTPKLEPEIGKLHNEKCFALKQYY